MPGAFDAISNSIMAESILLQTTIAETRDDWHVQRFSKLASILAQNHSVTVRNLQRSSGDEDTVISNLSESAFDQAWILGVDGGNGLNKKEIAGLSRFWSTGRGLLIARDHCDMGAGLISVGPIGLAHYFHSKNQEPDAKRRCRDDQDTPLVDWPNYHSGSNGDFQTIEVLKPDHPLTWNSAAQKLLREFPSHPHEGSVGVPPDCKHATLLVRGTSRVSGAKFGQVVAFENCGDHGRGIAESSFHHFADYNWDPRLGAPSFVTEQPSFQVLENPERLGDIQAYIQNLGSWLSKPKQVLQ